MTEALGDLDDTLWAAKPPHELLATMRNLEQLRSALDAVQLEVVRRPEFRPPPPPRGPRSGDRAWMRRRPLRE